MGLTNPFPDRTCSDKARIVRDTWQGDDAQGNMGTMDRRQHSK